MYMGRSLLIFSDVISKWSPGGHIGFFGFRTLTLVCFEYQLQTLVAQYLCIWVEAYWFSAVLISKWPPGSHIGFFGFQTLTFICLWIWTRNFNGSILVYMSRSLLIFSYLIFLNGCLVAILEFLGFWTLQATWFRQHNSSLLSNFSFKFHVHVLCGCRQKPSDFQLCSFQKGCLVILNDVQLQSTHCPLLPSPMGRGYPSRSLIYNF